MGFFNRIRTESQGDLPSMPPAPVFYPRFAERTDARRPCWVRGKKALFHQWVNSARPVLRNVEKVDENAQHYQLSLTHAVVEFEDGTVERVWPQDVKFADGGGFEEYAWLPMSEDADGDNQD